MNVFVWIISLAVALFLAWAACEKIERDFNRLVNYLRARRTPAIAPEKRKHICTYCGSPDALEPWTECPACQTLGKYTNRQAWHILEEYEYQINAQIAEQRRTAQ